MRGDVPLERKGQLYKEMHVKHNRSRNQEPPIHSRERLPSVGNIVRIIQ